MGALFIAGNGFDIAHGIPTKYRDFREFIIKMFPNALKYRDVIIHMKDFDDLDTSEFAAEILLNTMDRVCGADWCNFEEALAYVDFNNKFPKANHKEDETYEEDNELMKNYLLYMDRLTSGFIYCTQHWQKFFWLWIREVQIQIKPSMYTPKENLKGLFNDPEMLFFTFNYTKTLQKLYKLEKVTHIHNQAGQKLIFGHGQDDVMYGEKSNEAYLFSSFLDDMLMTFKKDTEFSMIRCKKFFKELNTNIDRVYSYGFSYGDVDSVYIKRIVNSISPQATWYFTTFEANDTDAFFAKKNKLRQYGFKGTFDIYQE